MLVAKEDVLLDCGKKYLIRTERGYTTFVEKKKVTVFTPEAQKLCTKAIINLIERFPTPKNFFDSLDKRKEK